MSLYETVQILLDEVFEVFEEGTRDPAVYRGHASYRKLVALPADEVTPVLLELLWLDPCWPAVTALADIHRAFGPTVPRHDAKRLTPLVGHWVRWGIHEGHLDAPEIDLATVKSR